MFLGNPSLLWQNIPNLIILSNLFDINYKISYSIIDEKQYIPKIIGSLIFEDRKVEKFFTQIETVLNNYVKKKIN